MDSPNEILAKGSGSKNHAQRPYREIYTKTCQILWVHPQLIETCLPHGYGSIPTNTIFSGMNIHLPAILMFTRGTRVLTHPHIISLSPIFKGHRSGI